MGARSLCTDRRVAEYRVPRTIWTVGYHGHDSQTLISLLQAEGISTVVDVRWTPVSRKKGFSKGALWASLAEADLDYQHLRELGAPKPLRDALSVGKDFAAFARSYRSHLRKQEESIDQLMRLVSRRKVCVLCLESDPNECHRSLLAEHVRTELGVEIVHLK